MGPALGQCLGLGMQLQLLGLVGLGLIPMLRLGRLG